MRPRTALRSLLGFNLRHRWLTPIVGLAVVASAYVPYGKIDKNFDTSSPELFVQVRYRVSEDLSLERKKQLVERVEAAIEPHREELMAESVYSFWNDRFALTRIYLAEGSANEENFALVRDRCRPSCRRFPASC